MSKVNSYPDQYGTVYIITGFIPLQHLCSENMLSSKEAALITQAPSIPLVTSAFCPCCFILFFEAGKENAG